MNDIHVEFIQTAWGIMDVLHQAQSTADGLAGCLDILCKALSCEQGSIWVKEKSGKYLYALAQRGDANLIGCRIGVGSGLTGQAAVSGEPFKAEKSRCEESFCAEEKEAGFPEGSLL